MMITDKWQPQRILNDNVGKWPSPWPISDCDCEGKTQNLKEVHKQESRPLTGSQVTKLHIYRIYIHPQINLLWILNFEYWRMISCQQWWVMMNVNCIFMSDHLWVKCLIIINVKTCNLIGHKFNNLTLFNNSIHYWLPKVQEFKCLECDL